MKFWEDIIQTAMLGTGKKEVSEEAFPEDLLEAVQVINKNEKVDAEEKFLQKATVAFNYRQSGISPAHRPGVALSPAPVEERKYCNNEALRVLRNILFEESAGLLKIWLQLCAEKEQLVMPDLIPLLLNKAVQHKHLKSLAQACTGKRGMWLSQFNEDWRFAKAAEAEELWQTGTLAERKQVLHHLRISDPLKAMEWLQKTWTVENANTKSELLGELFINLSARDVEWLETLLNEKSQKVKEQAFQLLKQIPSSAIIQKYQQFLRQVITVKKEKTFLGLTSKTVLLFKLPDIIDESIFKSGVDKLGNNKEFTDDEFIIYQVSQLVPPAFWENQTSLTPSEIIQALQNDITKKFIPAIVSATLQFRDIKWATALMKDSQVFYIDIIPLLSLKEQEFYSNKFFSGHEESIISYALQREGEWSTELTKNIFQYAAKHHYSYSRSFYNQHISLIPVQVVGLLEKCTPQEEQFRGTWSNTSEYIIKLITLKNQAIKAFQ